MALERVTDAATVEVGRLYLVPQIRTEVLGRGRRVWVPVTGPIHEDRDIIDFPFEHVHFDVRFFDAGLMKRFWRERRVGLSTSQSALIRVQRADLGCDIDSLIWAPMRCRRRMPDFPPWAPWLPDLEAAHAGTKLKPDCRTCPHRGLPLTGLPVRDGAVVCSGHGLRWNLTTGELVPRCAPQESNRAG